MSSLPIATPRELAAEAGRLYYSTGKPCKRGQLAPRKVSDRSCQCSACQAYRLSVRRGFSRGQEEE